MKPKSRRNAMIVVSSAAIATTGWSLCAVTSHYGTPGLIAFASVAAFDGIAYLALHLASEASAEGRSAFGARLTALVMAAISVALNVKHADLINGGTIASLAFSAPSIGLLAVSELSWAGPRAAKRAERGERPFRPASLGGWSWALAPYQAAKSVQKQARQHIGDSQTSPPPAAQPARHDAAEKLRQHFASMDPVELIQFASSALPGATPAEIAAQLKTYDISLSAMEVAYVLGHRPPVTTVERPDTVRTAPGAVPPVAGPAPLTSADCNPDRSGFRPELIKDAVQYVAAQGITDPAAATAEVSHLMGKQVREDTVRRYISDLTKQPKPPGAEQLPLGDGIDEGEGFYP